VLRVRECTPTPSSFVVFTFELAFDYFKELGGVLAPFSTNYSKGGTRVITPKGKNFSNAHKNGMAPNYSYLLPLIIITKNPTKTWKL
jgi:hypothetical protein